MPGEIFGDIRNAADNTPPVANNSNFAAHVAQLRYRRLQVAENVVESCGEFDSLAAQRVYTTAGSKKYRSYSSLPEPISFIGIENTPPTSNRTLKPLRKASSRVLGKKQQEETCSPQNTEASHPMKEAASAAMYHPLLDDPEPSKTTNGEAGSTSAALDTSLLEKSSTTPPATSGTGTSSSLPGELRLEESNPKSQPTTGKPGTPTPLLVDISLVEESAILSESRHADSEMNPSTCDTPLAYDWPIEGAKMLYTSPQQPSMDAKRSSPGSLADSHDSWKISSTNAILTAPPPVTAALEVAESFVNFATASISALSTSSQEFIDRSALNLKDAAARSHMTWQQAISKVGQALLSARTVIETPRLAPPEDVTEAEEQEEQEQVPPLLRRAVSISTTVKSGFSDAVQQAKDILRNI